MEAPVCKVNQTRPDKNITFGFNTCLNVWELDSYAKNWTSVMEMADSKTRLKKKKKEEWEHKRDCVLQSRTFSDEPSGRIPTVTIAQTNQVTLNTSTPDVQNKCENSMAYAASMDKSAINIYVDRLGKHPNERNRASHSRLVCKPIMFSHHTSGQAETVGTVFYEQTHCIISSEHT